MGGLGVQWEVQVSVPEEWVCLSHLPVPSAPASSHFRMHGTSGARAYLQPLPLPHLEFLCQINEKSLLTEALREVWVVGRAAQGLQVRGDLALDGAGERMGQLGRRGKRGGDEPSRCGKGCWAAARPPQAWSAQPWRGRPSQALSTGCQSQEISSCQTP